MPALNNPGHTDLGLWNVYANPDFPAPQTGLAQIVPKLMGLTTPQIDQLVGRSNRIFFRGTNGLPNSTCYVLASTNLSDWFTVATNTFNPLGCFNFSAPALAGTPKIFYKLSLRIPTPAEVLPRTLALFKTPTLRDLGHSDPYLHTGRMNSIEDTLRFYQTFSRAARQGEVRNAAPELSDVFLPNASMVPLAAFLRSLNEDYTD